MRAQQILVVQIITKTVETILQNRVEVKKPQQKQFNKVMDEVKMNKAEAYGGSIYTFLNEIILKELYLLRPKLTPTFLQPPTIFITITFSLLHRSTQRKIDAEHWEVEITKGQNWGECTGMIVHFFQQLMLLLNKQPLFSQYYKQKYLKANYFIDYSYSISHSLTCKDNTHIADIPAKYQRIRRCQDLCISLVCYYLPSLSTLYQNNLLYNPFKKNSSNLIEQSIQNQRKTSIYTFYDQQLDITFISSDNQLFKNTPENSISQIKVEKQKEEQEQFVMLYLDEDEKFLEENKQIFEKMAKWQPKYFQY